MERIPLTSAGAEKLRKELEHLKSVVRPEVIEAIAEARSHGDLSENAEYDAAKEKQAFVEARIADYEGKLANAQIINHRALKQDGRVVFGATVTFEDCDSGEKTTYQIVGEYESDTDHGKISFKSPLAKSLIGKEVGDEAEMNAPGGTRTFEILDVQYI